ncbi:E3 ubiquitin-protein ligase RNF185 [Frankliniella fusca]|uniref:E3 ubiquitin-protein ligase RNF185 n=1 Tax=Frankliniella fusca TaxID=407009 RepID=A0AAE1HG90_9NEOP|nr:E3 ubiquitin-protein ligase RNF185 [Frankliniella fusca]
MDLTPPESPVPMPEVATQTEMDSQPGDQGHAARPQGEDQSEETHIHYHYHFHFSSSEHEETRQPQPQQQQPVSVRTAIATTPNEWSVGNMLWPSPVDTPVRRGRGRPSNAERQLRAQVTALLQERQQRAPAAAQAINQPALGAPGAVQLFNQPQPLNFPNQPQHPYNQLNQVIQPTPPQQVQPTPIQQIQPTPIQQMQSTPPQQMQQYQAAQQMQPLPAQQLLPPQPPNPLAVGGAAASAPPNRALECAICRQPQADSTIRRCLHSVCYDCMNRWLVRRRVCPDPRCANECTISDVVRNQA